MVGGQGGCERRIEVFVKIPKKMGGSGGVGKFTKNIQGGGGVGSGGGQVGGRAGGGSGWM